MPPEDDKEDFSTGVVTAGLTEEQIGRLKELVETYLKPLAPEKDLAIRFPGPLVSGIVLAIVTITAAVVLYIESKRFDLMTETISPAAELTKPPVALPAVSTTRVLAAALSHLTLYVFVLSVTFLLYKVFMYFLQQYYSAKRHHRLMRTRVAMFATVLLTGGTFEGRVLDHFLSDSPEPNETPMPDTLHEKALDVVKDVATAAVRR